MLSCPQELISRQLEAIATTVLLQGREEQELCHAYPTNGTRFSIVECADGSPNIPVPNLTISEKARFMIRRLLPESRRRVQKRKQEDTDSNGNAWVEEEETYTEDRESRVTFAPTPPKPLVRCNTEPESFGQRRDALLPDWRNSDASATAEGIKSIRNEFNPLVKRSTVKRKMKRSRLVRKDGDCNVYSTNVPKKETQYLRDIFTTLIDAKWRWILITFSVIFTSMWSTFSAVYYIVCLVHGDLNPSNHSRPACIEKVDSVIGAFLFSVETQMTIGYGHRYVTEECLLAGATVCFQSLCGLLIQSFMVGLVFAKLARPKKRAETLIFSENALVTLRDGKLCFCFRVADMRASHLVEAHVRLQMISQRTTDEGEVEPLYQHDLNIGYDNGVDRIFLVWPLTICHEMNEDSPLYEYSARQLPTAQFEIIVLLEGIVESTGMTAQARTSYLPSEILWGQRFEKLITYQKYNGSYQIDYSLFHNTYPVNTPRCSPKEWDSMKCSGLSAKRSQSFFYKAQDEAEMEANVSTDEMTPIPSPLPPISSASSVVIHEEDDLHSVDTSSTSTLLTVRDGTCSMWKSRSNERTPLTPQTPRSPCTPIMPEIVVNSPPRSPSMHQINNSPPLNTSHI